jgi:DNA (cytosine-5)-methyltransferase 1
MLGDGGGELGAYDRYKQILEACFQKAELLYQTRNIDLLVQATGCSFADKVRQLAQTKHAARGALLTLLVYKALNLQQDIRCNKTEHPNGFGARSYDTAVTVPFLLAHALPRNVETHWLSQTLSYGDSPWFRGRVLKTTPKQAGSLLIEIVNDFEELIQERRDKNIPEHHIVDFVKDTASLILYELIDIRNKDKVLLTRPKNLVIEQIVQLLDEHFHYNYDRNAPRLPQLAIYALYKCLLRSAGRYKDYTLEPLGRMKAADRKAGTVGDIVLSLAGRPAEAVETKLGLPIDKLIVSEAIEKIRAASVERYFILSTAGVRPAEANAIQQLCQAFRASNGCEIIVNGVLETIRYCLRLLPSQYEFIVEYTDLVEVDLDLDYQHRVAWNQICADFAGA